jgi:hypothetical protein
MGWGLRSSAGRTASRGDRGTGRKVGVNAQEASRHLWRDTQSISSQDFSDVPASVLSKHFLVEAIGKILQTEINYDRSS